MASVAVPQSPKANGEVSSVLSADALLQLRYTELLEKRIAQLESVIESTARLPPTSAEIGLGPRRRRVRHIGSRDGLGEDGDILAIRADGDNENEVAATSSSKSRYKNVIRQFDKKTGIHADVELGGLELKKTVEGEVAFIFRKTISDDHDNTNTYSEVDVEAAGLRHLLRECIGPNYPGQNLDGDTVNIATPFAPLVHNWANLEEAVKEKEGDDAGKKQAREDLDKLLECVKAAPELEKYFKIRDSNLGAAITTYETMWTLFAPGTKVVAKLFLNQLQVLEVSRAPIPRRSRAPRELKVLGWCWDWNGKEMMKVYYWLPIERFWGTKDINQLFCYPLAYHLDGSKIETERLCKTLRERGKEYNRIVRSKPGASQMYSYDGVALSERRSVIKTRVRDTENDETTAAIDEDERMEKTRRKTMMVQGAFLVDPEAFLQFGADSQILGESEPVWTGELDSNSAAAQAVAESEDQEPTEDELLLFPPRFLGYSTKEKIWGQFGVDQTKDVPSKNTSLFKDKLQLDGNYKAMIQALVEEHGARGHKDDPDRVSVKDVVDDKGKGLVLLFHGPPGVGKTLTAETIAETTGKPLFVVSVAEIGLDASKAERNLEQMFYLAGKWEAVLLVDEADVFLESRTSNSDPNRNALVSVLLRVLEYYDGIMILTTNRITSLDIAVQSRIHLAIRYDDLTRDQKIGVFKMFLKQLKPDSIYDYEGIMSFIEEYGSDNDLNGRQIRNVVSSALSLARSRAKDKGGDERITVAHLKQVLNITKDFQKQLESITTEARASNEAARSKR